MADTLIRYEVDEGVAIFTIDDPPANTYTHEMMRDLDDAILKARFDEGVHVIVMRGEGEKFFSAGANINMLLILLKNNLLVKLNKPLNFKRLKSILP